MELWRKTWYFNLHIQSYRKGHNNGKNYSVSRV